MAQTIDYAPLTSVVTKEDVTAFRARHAGDSRYGPSAAGAVAIVAAIVIVMIAGFLLVGFIGAIASVLSTSPSGLEAGMLFVVAPILVFGVSITVLVLVIRGRFRNGVGGKWERWVRLERFAEANELVYSPSDPNPQYPGAIFSVGGSRAAIDHMRAQSGRFLDLGNYRYVTSNGKSSTTSTWGFMALELDRALPHMVLDSRANNGLFGGTNLPASFSRDQVLSLEGDFDQHFTLYCPKEYERDALYVFTPDLMALCIDEAAPFDIEVVDRWMFVYSAAAFDMLQPWVYERLLRIAFTVGAKTLTQTDRYADERVPDARVPNIVAPQGQRLKRGIPVVAVIVVLVVAAFWLLPGLIGVIAALFRV